MDYVDLNLTLFLIWMEVEERLINKGLPVDLAEDMARDIFHSHKEMLMLALLDEDNTQTVEELARIIEYY